MGAAITFARAGQCHFGIEHVRVAIEVLRDFAFEKQVNGIHVTQGADRRGARRSRRGTGRSTRSPPRSPRRSRRAAPVVLKPSELSPFSALLFAQVMHDAGTPPGVFNLVNGHRRRGRLGDVGPSGRRHGLVHRLDPRGRAGGAGRRADGQARGPGTGRQIAQRVPARCRLRERGAQGRARRDAQRRPVLRRADPAWWCLRSRLAEVEALAADAANGDRRRRSASTRRPCIGPLANAPQFAKVQELIQAGIDEGAKLVVRRARPAAGPQPRLFRAADGVLRSHAGHAHRAGGDLRSGRRASMPYEDEADAVRIANATVYGLEPTSSRPTRRAARRVARQIRAGQVHINYPAWSGYAPFGGYKQSGNGREYGVLRPGGVSRDQGDPRVLITWSWLSLLPRRLIPATWRWASSADWQATQVRTPGSARGAAARGSARRTRRTPRRSRRAGFRHGRAASASLTVSSI